ncbi:CAP domain-containing protein [Rhodococcus sp. IEGM 1408]|uniref:CAP domain-containing protein n=1 Tax=Rhodococcus sp. IEGM 1408 TaxID=3082220 RepID=UPI002953FC96|nr:CAP domain-containing protein [Rhodococcus sp. IEGM 1408]MDV8002203.1 CAP domain-containing protein [Rhodococcus sp. IEGM 1408]
MTRALTRLRSGLLLGAAASMAMALSAAPHASAQLPQIYLPGLTIGFALPAAPGAAPAIDPASAEYRAQLEGATNAARTAHGLAPLAVNGGLTGVATGWSGAQAAQNRMYHNPAVGAQIPAGWAQYGENVLQNYAHATPQQLVDQWMASPGHRANILNPGLNSMGVGAAVAGDGKLYATQVFARY